MSSSPHHPYSHAIAPFALRRLAAAKALGISVRLLDQMLKEGQIPHARVKGVVLIPVASLQQWLTDQTSKNGGQA